MRPLLPLEVRVHIYWHRRVFTSSRESPVFICFVIAKSENKRPGLMAATKIPLPSIQILLFLRQGDVSFLEFRSVICSTCCDCVTLESRTLGALKIENNNALITHAIHISPTQFECQDLSESTI